MYFIMPIKRTQSRKYSKKNFSRKVKGGGKKNFLRDSDMDFKELIEATGKESYMSEEQLYNSFYQKSNITRDKNDIIKHLKAMKKHTKDLKDSANSIGKEVDKVVKHNTALLTRIINKIRKTKEADKDQAYDKQINDLYNEWITAEA